MIDALTGKEFIGQHFGCNYEGAALCFEKHEHMLLYQLRADYPKTVDLADEIRDLNSAWRGKIEPLLNAEELAMLKATPRQYHWNTPPVVKKAPLTWWQRIVRAIRGASQQGAA